jgi:hypothetical protein
LIEEIAKAFVAIGDVLPRADLSAELYQTEYMKDALSRLYAFVIRFLQLCVRWYSRSSLGRFFSGLKHPFKLDYEDLVEQIKVCSAAIEDLANAGLRVEVRDISTTQTIHHSEIMDWHRKHDNSLKQLLDVAITGKAITERVDINVLDIKRSNFRMEFHHLAQFLAPEILPDTVLQKAQSFARRDPTMALASHQTVKLDRDLKTWALADRSSLLVVRMGPRAQKQARELAADVISGLTKNGQRVFWNISLPWSSGQGGTMADVFKSLLHQVLRNSGVLFTQFTEHLNLEMIQAAHTDSEW